MRAAADALRAEAKRIGFGIEELRSRAARTTFIGPAGDRFRDHLRAITSQAEQAATTLLELAGILITSADQAEEDIAAALRARERAVQLRNEGRP